MTEGYKTKRQPIAELPFEKATIRIVALHEAYFNSVIFFAVWNVPALMR